MESSASFIRIVACIAAVLAMAGPQPARADSSELERQYQCLKDPDAVCYDATPSGPDPSAAETVAEPPGQKAAPAPTSATAAVRPAPPERKPAASARAAGSASPAAAAPDPFRAIAARLEARKPSAADLAVLQARAKAGNARALELLAWAELMGVGVARDPVQAYFLYGKAAAAGAPTGRRDQAAVYEGTLTPEERQQILLIETGNLARDKP
jgi:TPR repeat protein